jgi:hypothetical protein
MNREDILVAISVLSVIGHLVNGWIVLTHKAQLSDLMERLERRFVPREIFEVQVRRIDERCERECTMRADG